MPRKEGQKLKLLTLLEIFVRETDEKHPISVPRMVELLKERGIVAERKSVYDDIQTLNEMPDTPFEIVQQRGRGGGYYMTDAPFELAARRCRLRQQIHHGAQIQNPDRQARPVHLHIPAGGAGP